MKRTLLAVLALSGAAGAQAQQVPPPAVEQALQQNVIVAINRSVDFDRIMPAPLVRVRPVVDDPQLARVDDALYIDRRLMPPPRAPVDESGAVRVYPRDRR